MPKLSILVASITKRDDKLQRLLTSLHAQASALSNPEDVEILTLVDDQVISIGEKRNKLLKMSTGEYTCFVDDDDRVFADYIEQILTAMAGAPDCISFTRLVTFNGANPYFALFEPGQKPEPGVKASPICHLCPIKRGISTSILFSDASFGEDAAWSFKVAPLLKTVQVIRVPLYHYAWQKNVSETSRSRRESRFTDDCMATVGDLPDWAFLGLVQNVDGVPLARRKRFAQHLVEIGSPCAKDQAVLDLLVETPVEFPNA